MRLLGIVVACVCLLTGGRARAGLIVLVEPDLEAYLFNPENRPLAFDGYHLSSPANALAPDGWLSISD